MSTSPLKKVFILTALVAAGSGCVNVKPWDRDALAHYSMRRDRDPTTLILRDHLWFSREAANGGRTVGGGGCGCN